MKLTLELTQDQFGALDEAASQPNQWVYVEGQEEEEGVQTEALEAAHKILQVAYDDIKG